MTLMDWQDEIEIVVMIKAAPEMGRRHGETVCLAGVDRYGRWHRLYPVPWRDLTNEQRPRRWDVIKVRWRRPADDQRVESKRIDPLSMRVISSIKGKYRHEMANRALVSSLEDEMNAGRSLALIRPEAPRFSFRRLSDAELRKATRRRRELVAQASLFGGDSILPDQPPYTFIYKFVHAGKKREFQCIDWETDATFLKWRNLYGGIRPLTPL